MHILLAVLGGIAAVAFFLYRLGLIFQMGRQVADTVGDPRRLWRRLLWQRKAGTDLVDTLRDPREAATVLMIAVGRAETGELSLQHRHAILNQMKAHFAMAPEAAKDMMSHLAWATVDMVDIHSRMRRLVRPLMERCTADEREDLAKMMESVAMADGGVSERQSEIIARYRQILTESRNARSRPGAA